MGGRTATVLVVALVVAAPPALAKPPGPAAVVRAWTAAFNRSDNEAGARSSPGTRRVQNGLRLVLSTHELALLWMQGVPCSAVSSVSR